MIGGIGPLDFSRIGGASGIASGGEAAAAGATDAAGSFATAEIIAAETTVQSVEVQACIIEIAKSLTYPKPASGKDIRYQRNFDFKARR